MNGPNLKLAPPQAKFVARDESGDWYWYSARPALAGTLGMWLATTAPNGSDAGYGFIGTSEDPDGSNWRDSLEELS